MISTIFYNEQSWNIRVDFISLLYTRHPCFFPNEKIPNAKERKLNFIYTQVLDQLILTQDLNHNFL